MREIKFREAITSNGVFSYWHYWGFMEHFGSYGNIAFIEPINTHEKSLQYTGLKDKNGKEIYEGDIWKRNEFLGKIIFEFSGWAIKDIPSSGSIQYPSFYSNADSGEIIGNIHENPELLEAEKIV